MFKVHLKKILTNELSLARKTFIRMKPLIFFAKPFWVKQILISSLALFLIPVGLLNPLLTKNVVDGPLMNKSTQGFLKYGLIMAVISLFILVIQNLINYFQNKLQNEMKESVTRDVYVRLTSLSLGFFKKTHRERNVNVLGGDGVEVIVWSMKFVPELLITTATLLVKMMMVFLIDWRLGLASLLSPPINFLRSNMLAHRNRVMARASREAKLAYSKELRDSLGTVDVMKSFHSEDYHINRFKKVLRRVTELNLSDYRFTMAFGTLSGFLAKLMDGIPAVVGAVLVTTGHLTLGELSAGMIFVMQSTSSVNQLIDMLPALSQKAVQVKICNSFLKQKPDITEKPDAKHVDFHKAEIRIDNVDFSYIPGLPVLRGLSLEIKGGVWTGISAPSGYGKTTLLNLILRLYDVKSGSIMIGGVDVREIRFQDFRDQIGITLQQMFFPRDTIERCIAYDREGVPMEDIREAARLAGVDEFASSLPKGYQTSCGEAAGLLSQGQRQRIMIARAILKKPNILIMDEAFGSVDAATEDKIIEDLKNRFPEMTVLVVSHNERVLQKMDQVVDLTRHDKKINPSKVFTVNYFDMGIHEGQEIDMLIKQLKDHPLVKNIHVYGVDANKNFVDKARTIYRDTDDIRFTFDHFAVSDQSGESKLYIHPSSFGSSIFSDKSGVTETYESIPSRKLTDWIRSQKIPQTANTVNILKANIEGAEWLMIQDLQDQGMLGYFDYYLGSTPGMFKDIEKVASLVASGADRECKKILQNASIYVHKFCHVRPEQKNFDFSQELYKLFYAMNEKNRSASDAIAVSVQ